MMIATKVETSIRHRVARILEVMIIMTRRSKVVRIEMIADPQFQAESL